jgi:DNA-binding FadR family transcriptional regulator
LETNSNKGVRVGLADLRFDKTTLRESIVAKIEQMILSDELKAGSKLPSEIALASSFCVSRNILREALNTLKERGIVAVRSGDGTYVVKPELVTVTNAINRLVLLSKISYDEVFEVRTALEVLAVGLSISNAGYSNFETFEYLLDQMRHNANHASKYTELVFNFHMEIAIASGNRLISAVLNSLHSILIDIFVDAYRDYEKTIPEMIEDHAKLVRLIRERKREAAERHMIRHISRSRSRIASKYKRKGGQR